MNAVYQGLRSNGESHGLRDETHPDDTLRRVEAKPDPRAIVTSARARPSRKEDRGAIDPSLTRITPQRTGFFEACGLSMASMLCPNCSEEIPEDFIECPCCAHLLVQVDLSECDIWAHYLHRTR